MLNDVLKNYPIIDNYRSSSIVDIAHQLAPTLTERAAEIDQNDCFVGENYALLKEAGLVEAGVPRELGGGGAEVPELAEMLRVLARACGSTALAFSMHTHQVAIPAWRWRHQKVAATEPLLKRVAAERIVLLSSGGSDWIGGSGKAEKVEGGYRITARKVFTSGAEAGNILMTGAIHEAEDGGRSVIHFGVPMKADEVRIEDNWRTLGMRGTASNDVVIENLFIPTLMSRSRARRASGIRCSRRSPRSLSHWSMPSISVLRKAPAISRSGWPRANPNPIFRSPAAWTPNCAPHRWRTAGCSTSSRATRPPPKPSTKS